MHSFWNNKFISSLESNHVDSVELNFFLPWCCTFRLVFRWFISDVVCNFMLLQSCTNLSQRIKISYCYKLDQVNGCLSYFDKVPDDFYLINGMDPYIWKMCTDLQENGRIPSLEMLKSVDTRNGSAIEAVLVDRNSDPGLKELQNRVLSLSCSCITTKEVVDQLAKLVCSRMG